MEKKSNAAAVISYITWIGFIIALLIRDKTDPFTNHHLNQALVLNIASLIAGVVASIPVVGGIIGWIASIAVFVGWIMGVVRAATWSMDPLPLIGDIHLIG